MEEKNLTKCKKCEVIKYRILDGKFDKINKRWKDESGRLWSGKLCPDCQAEKMRQHMKLKRTKIV